MKVSVLMGGTSAERAISLKTSKAVINACLELGYETTPVAFSGAFDSFLKVLKSASSTFSIDLISFKAFSLQ